MRTPILLVLLAACAHKQEPAPTVPAETAEPAAVATVDAPPAEPAPAPAPAATPIADGYRPTAARIIEAALASDHAWVKLAYMTDRIGHRLSGSRQLELAVHWAAAVMRGDGHENVRLEPVMVPRWVRGSASARIIAPVEHPVHLLALGGSPGTPRKGLTAQVLVVHNFNELEALGEGVRGKIVLFDVAMPPYSPEHGTKYGETGIYRNTGPMRAARLGAAAALVRSVTARSLRSPHTGMTLFPDGTVPIPCAAVSVEDAALIARLAAAGDKVELRLDIGARTLPDVESANVVAELRGRELPDEVIVLGAHIDSWDVGTGAHDDAAGCVIVMQALGVLRQLDLRPRRTIRVVLFTNEENGLRGGKAYAKAHAAELPNHVAALEADTGSFKPQGFGLDGNATAMAQLADILSLLASIEATRAEPGYGGADIYPMKAAGVPLLGLEMDPSTYFDYHHTEADTLDKVDPQLLRMNVAAVAVLAYVLADMPARFGQAP